MAPSSPSRPARPSSPSPLSEASEILNEERGEGDRDWGDNSNKWEKMEEIGGGIYLTPNREIDPLSDPSDCALWPDHPMCGGGIGDFINRSINPIKFGFDHSIDGCSACLSLVPIIGIRLAPYTVCYRWCAKQEPENPPLNPYLNPPARPSIPPANNSGSLKFYKIYQYGIGGRASGSSDTSYTSEGPSNYSYTIALYPGEKIVEEVVTDEYESYYQPGGWIAGETGLRWMPGFYRFKNFKKLTWYQETAEGITRSLRVLFGGRIQDLVPIGYYYWFLSWNLEHRVLAVDGGEWTENLYLSYWATEQLELPDPTPDPAPTSQTPSPQPPMANCCDLRPILKEISQTRKEVSRLKQLLGVPNSGFAPNGSEIKEIKFNSIGDGVNKLSKDFAQLQADFHRVLRPDEFGKSGGFFGIGQHDKCFIPKNFILPNTDGGEEAIENYQELILNIFKMIDRYIGSPKRIVQIKDVDPAKPGDQAVSMTSETLGDIMQNIMQFLLQKSSDEIKNDGIYLQFLTKILYQDGISYKNIQWLYHATQVILEGMGVGIGEKKEVVPMLFNYAPSLPPTQGLTEEALDKFYADFVGKTKNAQITVPHFKKEARSLVSYLVELNRNTGVTAASLGRNVDSKNGLETLVRAAYLSERLAALIMSRAANQPNNIGNLNDFLQDVESQFKERAAGDTVAMPLEPLEDTKFYGQTKKPKFSKRKSRRNRGR